MFLYFSKKFNMLTFIWSKRL